MGVRFAGARRLEYWNSNADKGECISRCSNGIILPHYIECGSSAACLLYM